jgi:predicted nucleic acid-binding protein
LPETLVVDCSVAAKWALQEPGRNDALRLLDEQEAGNISLIAPDLLLTEFAGLIAKRTRRKLMPAAQGYRAVRLMEESDLRLFEISPLLGRALDLAINGQMSLWDCIYLALAIEHDCQLITADVRLFRNGRGRHPAIRLLS